eukprot:TRINITY_DN616_c0_g1_i2.p1 TRINITY_DN616_c0_g1~~TRINITY_DN616_c0_g1_i2.p1  ORF type:complete len:310 (-),score=67.76 TRINITY_DN616_c0_g1_i2:81-1010(-)
MDERKVDISKLHDEIINFPKDGLKSTGGDPKAPEVNPVVISSTPIANPNNQTVECGLCYNRREQHELITHTCRSQVCQHCLLTFIQTQIATSSITAILCVYCGEPYSPEQQQQITENTDVLQKLKKLRRLQDVRKAGKNGVFCPNGKCGFGTIVDDSLVHVVCEECGFDFCASPSCLRPHHPGITCHEAKRTEKQQQMNALSFGQKMEMGTKKVAHTLQNAVSTFRVLVVTKSCPRCGQRIEKNGGCSHMHCAHCQLDFCWRCRQSYNGTHCLLENLLVFVGLPLLLPLGCGAASAVLFGGLVLTQKLF